VLVQATSPLLRNDFAQSITAGRMPNGDLTDSFVPSDGRAAPKRAPTRHAVSRALRKVTDMHVTSVIERPGSTAHPTVPATRGRRSMRERDSSRLCRACEAPIAGQEDTCWRCGANWVYTEKRRQSPLRVIAGGASADRPRGNTRVATQAEVDADRWADKGGSPGSGAIAAATSLAEAS
jgi:hypothetical protein